MRAHDRLRLTQLVGLAQPLVGRRAVALEQRHPGGGQQSAGPGRGGFGRGREHPVEPTASLAEESADAPVETQRRGQGQRGLRVTAAVQDRQQVGVFGAHPGQGLFLAGTVPDRLTGTHRTGAGPALAAR
ncbi:hypothetical protein OG252_44900 [Streptomyces sp. NBC_01352]